jgi:FG-GAP-like repeat/Abnormal spindle-like microcephaly-assoc'd, ASPM-SPD-2-Hydin
MRRAQLVSLFSVCQFVILTSFALLSLQPFGNAADFVLPPTIAGPSPNLVTGDFNGDGILDIACSTGQQVQIWLGTSSGTFQLAGSSTVSVGGLVAADLNRDGRLDLVGTGGDNNVYVLLGNGDGTLQAAQSFAAGLTPASPVVGDFNNDGIPDIAVANTTPTYNGIARNLETVSLLLGNGDGSFRAPNSTYVEYNLGVLGVGDFNGDHKLDLIVGGQAEGSNTTVFLLKGDGTGNFNVQMISNSFTSYGASLPVNLAVSDFNRDGYMDFAISDNSGISVYLNSANQFVSTPLQVSSIQYPYALAVDLNNDGIPDLVLADQDNTTSAGVSVLIGNGDGTFKTATNYWTGFPAYTVTPLDLNKDGNIDLLVSEYGVSGFSPPPLSLYLGNGDGTLQAPINYSIGGVSSAVLGDFNNDGNLDVSEANYGGSGYHTFLGQGDGTLQVLTPPPNEGGGIAADFNGDGNLDLVMLSMGASEITLGNGDGTFRQPEQLPGAYQGVAADFNKDGKVDLAIVDPTSDDAAGDVSILLGNGDGTFKPATSYPTDVYPLALAVGDFNSDGNLDLAVANQNSNDVSILLGKGDGTFSPTVNYAAGTNPECVVAADFNHDGNLDLLVCDAGGSPQLLLGRGDGTFQPPVVFSQTGAGKLAAVADFDGDGNLDVILQSSSGVSILYGNSNGSYTRQVNYGITQQFFVGDFNHDGAPDLALASGGTLTILLNHRGAAVTLAPASLTFPTQVVSTISKAQTVTLTNSGLEALKITKIAVSGPFSETNNCGSIVKPGKSCTLTVTFTPTTTGTLNGSISITDNAPLSPQTIKLQGTGTAVQLSPASLNFGNQAVGTRSVTKKVTLANKGSAALSISKIKITGTNPGDFAQASNCGTSLAAGASCLINVTFTPTAAGSRSAAVSVTDNGGSSPQSVALTGTGT